MYMSLVCYCCTTLAEATLLLKLQAALPCCCLNWRCPRRHKDMSMKLRLPRRYTTLKHLLLQGRTLNAEC